LTLGVASALAGLCADAQAAVQVVTFPNAADLIPGEPPLRPRSTVVREIRLPRRISSRQRVLVGVDATGEAQSVRVIQRLTLVGFGDYTFSVPAPAMDVSPGPGSQSQPGRRPDEIVWSGFTPGRRIVSADASLRREAAVGALPLTIGVQTLVGGRIIEAGTKASGPLLVRLTVRNVTATGVPVFTADADARDAAGALDELRRAVEQSRAVGTRSLRVSGPVRARRAVVTAPFRIAGELRFPNGSVRDLQAEGGNATVAGSAVRFSGPVGGSSPEQLRVTVHGLAAGTAVPRLRLVATPIPPPVSPPARNWAQALRLGRITRDGRALLRRAIDLDIAYALARRYGAFLANPDPGGPSRATYVYATTARRATPTRAEQSASEGGLGLVAVVAIVVSLLLMTAAAVVAWAHL
jgi:hypothetical protein